MSYIETVSGKNFNYLIPSRANVDLQDIAQGLSMICRYAGQIPKFYSVAEHCVLGLWHLPYKDEQVRKAWLMHDATEAYISDIPSPLKMIVPGIREYEDIIAAVIEDKFDISIDSVDRDKVKDHDRDMLKSEAAIMGKNVNTWDWVKNHKIITRLVLYHWPPQLAYELFLLEVKLLWNLPIQSETKLMSMREHFMGPQ